MPSGKQAEIDLALTFLRCARIIVRGGPYGFDVGS